MNFCQCGAEPSYPHEWFCPYPLFRGSVAQEDAWRAAARQRIEESRAKPTGGDDSEFGDRVGNYTDAAW